MNTGERERLKVTESMVAGVVKMVAAIPLEDVESLSQAISHQDAFMPLFDPTGWMYQHEGIRAGAEIIAAFVALRRVIESVKQDERVRRETARLRR